MLTNVSQHMGEVAGENAAGGSAVARLKSVPRVLHTLPGAGWIGLTEDAARAEGYDVVTGSFDLAYNARAITMGAREGMVKVVAERELGEILGVHAVGPGIEEMLAVAAAAMQAEISVHDLAATVAWHPSLSEGLIDRFTRGAGDRLARYSETRLPRIWEAQEFSSWMLSLFSGGLLNVSRVWSTRRAAIATARR